MLLQALLPVALLAAWLSPPARAAITPEARVVLDRYIQAIGGREAVESVKSMRIQLTLQAFELPGTTIAWSRKPDRHVTETTLGPFKLADGYDGSVGWRTDPSGKVVVLDGKDLEDSRANAYFENDGWLASDQGGGKVKVSGTEKDSAGAYIVLEVTPPIGRSRKCWFKQDTGLLDRVVHKRDQHTQVTFLSDYRNAGGRLFPHTTVQHILEMPANDVRLSMDSVWVNEPIADSRFSPPGQRQEGARFLKTTGVARLPFRYSSRHVWLKVSVNGQEPADFLYDTGASLTVIDSAYAAKIGIKTEGQMQAQGAGAAGGASFSQLDSIEVRSPTGDGVELRNQKVAVLSVNPFIAPFLWRDAAGVLGYDFISRFVSEIDFDRSVLTLYDPKAFTYAGAGKGVPFRLAGTVPVIAMKIDGAYEGEFRVDVGSGSTVDVHGPFVKKHDLKGAGTIDVLGGGFGGTFRSQLTRMKKIEIGPYSWERPIVSLSGAEGGALASEDYAGNIGNQILERFKCTFDYEHRTLYLEPGKKYRDPDHFSRTGVQLARFGSDVKAVQVIPGSPAEMAGLKEGDQVIAVEGKPVGVWSVDDVEKLFDQGAAGRKILIDVSREGKKRSLKMYLRDLL